MSVSCASCGAVNYDEAVQCRRCDRTMSGAFASDGREPAYAGRRPKTFAASQAGASGKTKSPTWVKVASALALLLIAGVAYQAISSQEDFTARCTASATAKLDEKYTVHKLTKFLIPISTTYEVTYSFSADGRTYRGKTTLGDEPTSLTMPVSYNPSDPSESFVGPPNPHGFGNWGLSVGGVGGLLLLAGIFRHGRS